MIKSTYFFEGDRLYYYREPGNGMLAIGFIDLKGANLKANNNIGEANTFSILTPTRIWYLKALNEEDFEYWINGIKNLQQLYNHRVQVSRSSRIKELEVQRGKKKNNFVLDILITFSLKTTSLFISFQKKKWIEFEKFAVDNHNLKEEVEIKNRKIKKLNGKINSLLQIIKSKDIQLDQKLNGAFSSLEMIDKNHSFDQKSPNENEISINSPEESTLNNIQISQQIEDHKFVEGEQTKTEQIKMEDLKKIIHHLQKENSYLKKKIFDLESENVKNDQSFEIIQESHQMTDYYQINSEPESNNYQKNQIEFNSDPESPKKSQNPHLFKILQDD